MKLVDMILVVPRNQRFLSWCKRSNDGCLTWDMELGLIVWLFNFACSASTCWPRPTCSFPRLLLSVSFLLHVSGTTEVQPICSQSEFPIAVAKGPLFTRYARFLFNSWLRDGSPKNHGTPIPPWSFKHKETTDIGTTTLLAGGANSNFDGRLCRLIG